jgi:hypothetical protein
MTALNYPSSPSDGDQYTANGATWTYEAASTSWRSSSPTLVENFVTVLSNETTAFVIGTNKQRFRLPYAFKVTAVYAEVSTAQTSGSIIQVDINVNGTSMLSTKLTIDNGETDSNTAATPAVMSSTSFAARDQFQFDLDQVGDGTARGLKVTIVGYKTA